MTQPLTTFGVVGALIERDGRFLLVRESMVGAPTHPDKGKWNHPAGKLEVGESPLLAVRREVREETGYDFTPTHLLGLYSLVRSDIAVALGWKPHALKIIYLGTIAGAPQALADDVSETRWFTAAEIEAMPPTELRDVDIKQMVRHVVAGYRFPMTAITHTDAT